MGDDAQLWSEHTPNLYTLRAVIKNGENKEEQCRTFGLREFKANGTRFEINGQPVFLRGTLECCIFPLTGYPAMDNTFFILHFPPFSRSDRPSSKKQALTNLLFQKYQPDTFYLLLITRHIYALQKQTILCSFLHIVHPHNL